MKFFFVCSERDKYLSACEAYYLERDGKKGFLACFAA
jgi:hypothetical protein